MQFCTQMSDIHRTYKFRLYPTAEQERFFAKQFGCVRYVYNYYLDRSIKQYEATKKKDSCFEQINDLVKLKRTEEYSFLKEAIAQSLQVSLQNLDAAYKNFFAKRARLPRFKSKKEKNSFSIPQKTSIKDGKLYIQKLKSGIPIRLHREIKGKIGSVTISKTPTGKYYASILTKEEYEPLPKTGKSVGIDMGLKELVTTSEGEVFANGKFTKRYERKLASAQKHLARKQKGSHGFEKQKLKVARIHKKLANCRRDYLHKCSHLLVKNYDVICIEDLNVKGMVRNRRLAKSIIDASWGAFADMLSYKAQWNDKQVVKVDRFFPSSQTCNVCGFRNAKVKNLKVREWECPECHTHHDRDVNAAINILKLGTSSLSAGTVDYTDGESTKPCSLTRKSSTKSEALNFSQ
jgi:putative transposase